MVWSLSIFQGLKFYDPLLSQSWLWHKKSWREWRILHFFISVLLSCSEPNSEPGADFHGPFTPLSSSHSVFPAQGNAGQEYRKFSLDGSRRYGMLLMQIIKYSLYFCCGITSVWCARWMAALKYWEFSLWRDNPLKIQIFLGELSS